MDLSKVDLFTKSLLVHGQPLHGSAWPDDLKTEYLQLIRAELSSVPNLNWINMASVAILTEPETFFRPDAKVKLERFANESLNQPVSIDNSFQKDLETIFLDLSNNLKDGDKDVDSSLFGHIKDQLVGKPGSGCIKLDFINGEVEQINFEWCDSSGITARDNIAILADAAPYEALFKYTPTIYFLNCPSFGYLSSQTKPSIFSHSFTGAFLGFKEGFESAACVCTLEKLRPFVYIIGQTLFAKKLIDEGDEFVETLKSYKKQLQMLRLLASPLEKLTDALDETIEYTQRLRAILYDPSRAIFATAPRAMVYLEEGRTVGRGALTWQTWHDPDKAVTDSEKKRVRLSLAAVICEIFGRMDPWPENEGALISRAESLLTEGVAQTLGSPDEEAEKTTHQQLRQICRALMGGQICFDDLDRCMIATNRFKRVIYRPFKDGDHKYPLEPLLVGLFGFKDQLTFSLKINNEKEKTFFDLTNALSFQETSLFDKVGLPVPRYAHWLALILGVVEYAKSREEGVREVASATVEISSREVCVRIEFDGDGVFTDSAALYERMEGWSNLSSSQMKYVGNFNKSFADFMMLTEGGCSIQEDGFVIEHQGTGNEQVRTCILASGKNFCYSSRIVEAAGLVGSTSSAVNVAERDHTEPANQASSPLLAIVELPSAKYNEQRSEPDVFAIFYYNHASDTHDVETKFKGKFGKIKQEILPTNSPYSGKWSLTLDGGTNLEHENICCFVHESGNRKAWIDLALNNPRSLYIIFVSGNRLSKDTEWPDNIGFFKDPINQMTDKRLDTFIGEAEAHFCKTRGNP